MSHTHQLLRKALMEHRVIPYFQPIIDASTGTYAGAEVLARIHHINGEIFLPASFLTSYTTHNELVQMTRILMNKAANFIAEIDMQRDFILTFNITPDMICENWLIKESESILNKLSDKVILVLEITEQRPLNLSDAKFITGIHLLRDAGIRIALDDFGTGYCGFSLLQKSNADIIKIPRHFILGAAEDNITGIIVDNMLNLADKLKLEIIAEGVSSRTHVTKLSEKGVRMLQGEFYSMPVCFTDFLLQLKSFQHLW